MTSPILAGLRATVLALAVLATPAAVAAPRDNATTLRYHITKERARPRAPLLERRDFLARAQVRQVQLSHDGRHVAILRDDGRRRGVWLQATAKGDARRLLLDTPATGMAWSRDGRWLFLVSPRQVFALAIDGRAASRAIATFATDGRDVFAGVDPTQPAAIVLRQTPPVIAAGPRRWRAWRVAADGERTLLHADAQPFADFALDVAGRVAWLLRVDVDRHRLLHRDASGRWREAAQCVRAQRCLLLGTLGDDVLVHGSLGSDLEQLWRLGPDGKRRALHADPRGEADLDDVTSDPQTGEPLIASYRSTTPASYGLTAALRRHVTTIRKALPQRDVDIDVGVGADARWLVRERAVTLSGHRFHLFDPANGSLREILTDARMQFDGAARARPAEARMARPLAVTWRASDGMRLHGFVWLPPGIDVAKAPLVARIHGGPFSADRPEWDGHAQFLANRGYVVFAPNYRGSTAHGQAYKHAAAGDFGNGRVQRDIVEGVRWLLAQGVGDRGRVGIAGYSFGGYSALLGVTFEPELFKAAMAVVPPADFGWVLRDYARSDAQWAGLPLATQLRLLGLDPADAGLKRRLAAQSPDANAARLRRPVVIVAGGLDERVPIRGVTQYAARVQARGGDVSLFVDPDAGHDLATPRTREADLFLSESLFHRTLGGAAPQPAEAALLAHLEHNLRLKGKSQRPAPTRAASP